MRGVLEWGRSRGARHAHLQVMATNEPAHALYDGLGFTSHHRYHYSLAADVTAASRERFAAVVRSEPVDLTLAALLVGVETEPDLDLVAAENALADLADAVPAGVAGEPAAVSAARLREVLHPYSGRREDYQQLQSSLLHEVLRRRRGLPILLAVLWVEVGRRAGIAVYPVGHAGPLPRRRRRSRR